MKGPAQVGLFRFREREFRASNKAGAKEDAFHAVVGLQTNNRSIGLPMRVVGLETNNGVNYFSSVVREGDLLLMRVVGQKTNIIKVLKKLINRLI